MILTPGQLYFINEEDITNGTRSNYFKIGIVRGAADRDSKDRLLEHQTGNPRKLCIVETIDTPAVEAIETNLHYLFARNRVMGEWMCFTDSELKAAVAKAKELSAEIMKNAPIVELAKSLATQKSNGIKIPASDEAKDWYSTIQNYAEVIDICESLLADYGSYLKTAIEKGVNVKGKAKIQKRAAAKKFNEKIFIAKYPDLYKQYSTVTHRVRGSFRLAPAKDWEVDISTISDEQVALLEEFKTKLESADHSIETGFILHSLHLGVLEIQKYAEWESDLANQNLRALTGHNEGIEGICTWKREEKEVRVFDKDALQAEFPDAYNDCVIEGNETEALIVEPKMADI